MESESGTHLDRVLSANRREIADALAKDETELARLKARVRMLEGAIFRARLALGEDPEQAGRAGRRATLHQAMLDILTETPGGLTARELTDEINRRGAYRQKDGSPVPLNQVHARASNYPQLFVKANGKIKRNDGSS
jgi:hypothetical protein